jgi:hypothetical protein
MFHILESTSKCFILVKRDRNSKFAPKLVKVFTWLLFKCKGISSLEKSHRLYEVSCDNVVDETNGSQIEQVDLNELNDEEAPCRTLKNMSIRYLYP